jgi:hypothetical protein
MTDDLRDRVARKAYEMAVNAIDGMPDFADLPGPLMESQLAYADATLAEVVAHRRERLADFEAAVERYAQVAYSDGDCGGCPGYEDAYTEAMAALVKLWLEG